MGLVSLIQPQLNDNVLTSIDKIMKIDADFKWPIPSHSNDFRVLTMYLERGSTLWVEINVSLFQLVADITGHSLIKMNKIQFRLTAKEKKFQKKSDINKNANVFYVKIVSFCPHSQWDSMNEPAIIGIRS